ncbi:hypothetical protein [Streptomyces sp. SAJ15]|uniref:hypothetical protein n=1 Tax=Streptomyces sp. SAJ15 TaxID=2011095 RepID=UPI0011866246|nr:hypothetical protein [Streptomyces sp. SAJ15]
MFRSLAKQFGPDRQDQVFLVHPLQLSRWLDEAWTAPVGAPVLGSTSLSHPPFLGSNTVITDLALPDPTAGARPPLPSGINLANPDLFNDQVFIRKPLIVHQLIYAYLIEATGAYEVLSEVVRRLALGETLNAVSPEGLQWARATEELFFRDPPLFTIGGIHSRFRPDIRVETRRAYWIMFGFDLPHPVPPRWAMPGGVGAVPWKVDIGDGVNVGFREKWSELLRQIWLGVENQNNGIGPNPTDSEYVGFLCKAIKDMLAMRRIGGRLAREEFVHVTTMSWFHLTLEQNTSIVRDLKCEGAHPSDRLARIAQRVGMTPAPRARELFDLADLMSAFLRSIELGMFDTGTLAQLLFLPTAGNAQLRADVNRIIDLWQSATGDRVKERPAVVVGGRQQTSAQPLRLPGADPGPTVSGPSLSPEPFQAAVGPASGNGQRGERP